MKYIFKILKRFYLNTSIIRNYSVNQNYDICIVGGGPVGFGVASLLSSQPNLNSKKILLLESQKEKIYSKKIEFSNRTVALSPQTRDILEKCGAWEIISNDRYHCVKKMFVWEQCSESFIAFENDNMNVDLAYIVETDVLEHAITSTLNGRTNVQVKYNSNVTDIVMTNNEAKLVLADESQITTALVIGADGYGSNVRKLAKIKSICRNNNQKAIVGVVKFVSDINNSGVAWQRFTRFGPIAYLPLDETHGNFIWSTDGEKADHLMTLSEEQFVNELNKEMFTNKYCNSSLQTMNHVSNYIINMLPPFVKDNDSNNCQIKQLPPTVDNVVPRSRAMFPLGFMHATNYVSRNIALIGDAAHRILPLAGQGVNLGFGDVECLVRCLSDGADVGETINDYLRLQEYETERQRYVLPVALTVQGLNEIYRSNFLPIVIGRAVGLKFVNSIKPLKNFFVQGATQGKLNIYDCFSK